MRLDKKRTLILLRSKLNSIELPVDSDGDSMDQGAEEFYGEINSVINAIEFGDNDQKVITLASDLGLSELIRYE